MFLLETLGKMFGFSVVNEPSAWCLCTKFVQHALASVPCFRIWGHFPPFHVLGFGVIFRHSSISNYRKTHITFCTDDQDSTL